jgi:hypothetical protein
VEQGLEVGCPARCCPGQSPPDTVEDDQARMNQDLETGAGEAKAESEEELGGHAWCVETEWPVPMLQIIRDMRMIESRVPGSPDPRHLDSRQSGRTHPGVEDGPVGTWPLPGGPQVGSVTPKVHVWTGRGTLFGVVRREMERTPRGASSGR